MCESNIDENCLCTHDRDVILFCSKRCPVNQETEQFDCSLPDPVKVEGDINQCDDLPEECRVQFETEAPVCGTCQQWKDRCVVEPEIDELPLVAQNSTTTVAPITEPPTTAAPTTTTTTT